MNALFYGSIGLLAVGVGLLICFILLGMTGFFTALPLVFRDVKQTAYEALPVFITGRKT
jgi:hypothetical protein